MRISTTTIESFRLFMQPEQEWMTEDSLLATIRGEFVPTPAVLLGQAFGRILEHPTHYAIPNGYRCGGYTFDSADIGTAWEAIGTRGVFEAKATKAYGPHDVVACADMLLGADLSEFKTTSSSFDIDKYLASCQWRFMADIFQPARITYHVFLLDDHGNGVAEVKGVESFRVYPYPRLHEDCAELVARFAEYVTAKGLDGLLRQRQEAAA